MTRYQVLTEYEVQDGMIRTPGRFGGQALYVPYFWKKYLDGNAHEVDKDSVQFSVEEIDRIQFPELGARSTVRLRHDGNKISEA